MNNLADLLIEIGTEELPPLALPTLSNAFADGLRSQLHTHGIAHGAIEQFAAPRRLALLIRAVVTQQPDQITSRRGPAVAAAFTADGQPTPAALGFARSCGVEFAQLQREETDKGAWLSFHSQRSGAATALLVPAMTEASLAALPIPKRMRWGAGEAEFVRPVQWICLLLGDAPIAGTVLGVTAGAFTRGHRFHHSAPIPLTHAADYADALRNGGFVEPSFDQRRELIRKQVTAVAEAAGLRARIDAELLEEVTALVEWPQALLCHFEARYLEIPPEVLIETMQRNQKYFPLENASGQLQASFIAVTNLVSSDSAQIRAGNERVIRPRFADAEFFWAKDLKQPLGAFAERLEAVVFQDKLGTIAAKSRRVAQLGQTLARHFALDPALIARAAQLSKCDLVTAMVYEFPSLQGTMGRYYAERAGEPAAVCAALAEQYQPKFAGDALPASDCGKVLALAERIDTLVGIFGIGQRPTGTRDPYALRRASISVLRLLIENEIDLDLREVLQTAAAGFDASVLAADTVDTVLSYVFERLDGFYNERGVTSDTVAAVVSCGGTNPCDLHRRIAAVTAFRALPAAEALAAANKRIRNILNKNSEMNSDQLAVIAIDSTLLIDAAEIQLAARITELSAAIQPLAAQRDYLGVLTALADLRSDVDAFFNEVMVMANDTAIRINRLRLLHALADLFLQVADLSRLQ